MFISKLVTCAIIGTVFFGTEISLKDAGHNDHMHIFKAAAFCCLNDKDLADILHTEDSTGAHVNALPERYR